jgi:hypothetical protein
MLQTMGPNEDPGMRKIILSEIALLRKMPALAKRIQDYQPQPNPLLQKKTMLEIALLEAQVKNETAKGAENTVDVRLKSAKASTEEAKARNLNSKSDQQDLNFLEQESGLSRQHEADMKDMDRRSKLDEKAADYLMKDQGTEQTPNRGQGFTPIPAL